MNAQPSQETSRAITIVRECLANWRPDTFSLERDGAPHVQTDADSYFVEWEMKLQPALPTACPLEVTFAVGCCPRPLCVGFGFDSRERLAARLNLKSQSIAFVFGVEPVTVSREQIRAILAAVYEGQIEARYLSAFGRMVYASGRLLVDVGLPHLRGVKLGGQYRYSPYATAARNDDN